MPSTRVTGNGSLPLFELARVLMRLNHIASFIENANRSIM
jgi:hypothetical protein